MASHLRILLLGKDDDIARVGNILLGRKAFVLKEKVTQRHSVHLQDKRILHVTVPMGGQVCWSESGHYIRDELVSEMSFTFFHAVLVIVQYWSVYDKLRNIMLRCMLDDAFLSDFIQKKGVTVVVDAHKVEAADKNGKKPESFPHWPEDAVVLVGTLNKKVHHRCLILNTRADPSVLAKKREDLIELIDTKILVGEHYTDTKFNEIEQRCVMIERELVDLHLQMLTSKPWGLRETETPVRNELDKKLQDMSVEILTLLENPCGESVGMPKELQDKVRTTHTQLLKLKQCLEEIKTKVFALEDGVKDVKEISIWEQIKLLNQSVPNLTSP